VDGSFDPYKILVSEVMLQQTQVSRVTPKYQAFLERFPDVETLAQARLGKVVAAWSGLGYNRRAKYLHQAATLLVKDFDGVFPQTLNMLIKLPGVGKNTAAALLVYAFNQPQVFIETNIRTVYIHHFFADTHEPVSDAALLSLLEATVDHEHPREFYWALMDYGTHLKASVGNLSRQSKHYVKQLTFAGSRRQIRGQVLRQLTLGSQTFSQLQQNITDERLLTVLSDLAREDLVIHKQQTYQLSS
jgi:A/G-specific adenine glycosylase